MAKKVFNIKDPAEYKAAGYTDLIAMIPVEGSNQIFVYKIILEILCLGIARKHYIHLSGPTGSAKSSLIEALTKESENFYLLCRYMDIPPKPIYLYDIEMAIFETPAELYQRRSLLEGNTYDEPSILVNALKDAVSKNEKHYPLVFLKEMGRVHTSSVQGGLLNLMSHTDIVLPDKTVIPGGHVSYIADSNYQAIEDAQHTLVTFDEALKRRFQINVLLDYLPPAEERNVLEYILLDRNTDETIDKSLIDKIVRLGDLVRQNRSEGSLLSVAPPTIYGYLSCYELAKSLPNAGLELVITNTLLGNASRDDMKIIDNIISTIFHTQRKNESYSVFEDVF